MVPEDSDFTRAACVFLSSTVAWVTLSEHLVNTHWIVSNGLLLASARHLSTVHPLRCLIAPHVYGVADINLLSVNALAPSNGLACRTFAIAEGSWDKAVSDLSASWKYETLEQHFRATGLPDEFRESMPLYKDGFQLWAIFEKYVSSYVNLFYDSETALQTDSEVKAYWDDFSTQLPAGGNYGLDELSRANLIGQLTHSLFWITGMHTFFGDVAEYSVDPSLMPLKLPIDQNVAVPMNTVNGAYSAAALTVLTALPKPGLINDWRHLHTNHSAKRKSKVLAILNEWQDSLTKLSAKIVSRIKSGKDVKPFDKMDPRKMLSSVSV